MAEYAQLPENLLPDMTPWKLMMDSMKIDGAIAAITEYLENAAPPTELETLWLECFMVDFNQIIDQLLSEKAIAAHQVFRIGPELYTAALKSVDGMLTYVCGLINSYAEYLTDQDRKKHAVSSAARYIRTHLNTQLTRADIARHVHLSQNYLARIFKKEMGMSISDFIIRQRIDYAVQMLTCTSLSISEIAVKAGYESYSYFYTTFCRLMGMNPSQYREKVNAQLGD